MAIGLFDIKDYLKERRLVSVQDVAYHFRISESLAESLIETWVQKGKVKALSPSSNAGGCSGGCGCGCSGGTAKKMYRWIES